MKAYETSKKSDSQLYRSMSKNKYTRHLKNYFNSSYNKIMHLQRTIGNQDVGRFLKSDALAEAIPNRTLESPTGDWELSRVPIHVNGMEMRGNLRPGNLSISGEQDVGPPVGLTRSGGGRTGLPASAPVTANEINSDLGTAQIWATTAAQKMQRYSRIVRFMAQEPNLAYRIGTTRLGRGLVHGVNCPVRSNFNLDPVLAQPTAYASAMLSISARLNGIKATLDRLEPRHFRNVSVTSSLCDRYGAFVMNKSLPIYLCTGYWLGVFRRPATIIHEVAHVRGMDDQEYIRTRGMGLPPRVCRNNTRFSIEAGDTIKNPDSYAYFCADLRSQQRQN